MAGIWNDFERLSKIEIPSLKSDISQLEKEEADSKEQLEDVITW
jgi:hypothetical protein